MFEKEELQLLYKALQELPIKGSDSHLVAALLNKVATLHEKPEAPQEQRIGKTKVGK